MNKIFILVLRSASIAMDIQTTLDNYKSLSDYFAPDYERDNEVLNGFKKDNPNLSRQQATQLIDILNKSNDVTDKYFVGDLLYLYHNFDRDLLEPLLLTAINHKDPSFNRIFIRPCIAAFGSKIVSDFLTDRFLRADILERIGISKLLYWLEPQENGEADNLHRAILEKAGTTSNLIELYYYKLIYSDKVKDSNKVPSNAIELIDTIKGNEEYEDLLFNKLKWTKNNSC